MLIQNSYNLAGGQHIREQPTRMVGDAEARKDRAADMLGVVGAERSRTVDRDLPAVYVETPPDDIPLVDIADALVGAQFVQRLRRAVLGKIAGGGQGYHPHVADAPGD